MPSKRSGRDAPKPILQSRNCHNIKPNEEHNKNVTVGQYVCPRNIAVKVLGKLKSNSTTYQNKKQNKTKFINHNQIAFIQGKQ